MQTELNHPTTDAVPMPATDTLLPIGAVERETGLSKDVLRKWEARYGFPAPQRDPKGERVYPAGQVRRLRSIKRLMDTGLRPSRLIGEDEAGLAALTRAWDTPFALAEPPQSSSTALDLLRIQDSQGLRRALYQRMLKQGLEHFVQDTIAPLNQAVGDAWARGDLPIHAEHLYTEAVHWVLRNAVASISDPAGHPRVLLTTLPEEPHGLGILMAAALLALEGAYCISLGTQTPAEDIAQAAGSQAAEVVALSFSLSYPQRRILPSLRELKGRLGGAIELWAGGAGAGRLPRTAFEGRLLPRLEDALPALSDWRSTRG